MTKTQKPNTNGTAAFAPVSEFAPAPMKPFLPCALLALSLGGAQVQARAADLNPDAPPRAATATEIKQGDAAAAAFEKSPSVQLLDPKASPEAQALSDKLNAMARKLGAISPRPNIKYFVKVVENKDVNAFTLPDGKIYVYRGLLKFAASDDEIAGVIAHEIGHNVRLHALRGAKLNKKFGLVNLLAIAGMMLGARSGQGREAGNAANIAQFSQYMLVGVMNGYGVGYEKEADAAGVSMMIRAGYNPAAMVTFMERLELQEQRSPEMRLGIFQTHPPSDERAQAATREIEEAGIPFAPREVAGALQAVAAGKGELWSVSLGEVKLFDFAGKDAQPRAQAAATRTNALLRADLKAWEVSAQGDKLIARGQVLAQAMPADGAAAKTDGAAVAQSWLGNFRRLFWREQLNGKF